MNKSCNNFGMIFSIFGNMPSQLPGFTLTFLNLICPNNQSFNNSINFTRRQIYHQYTSNKTNKLKPLKIMLLMQIHNNEIYLFNSIVSQEFVLKRLWHNFSSFQRFFLSLGLTIVNLFIVKIAWVWFDVEHFV